MHYHNRIDRQETILFCLDDFVPQNHNVRLIDKIVNNIINEENLFIDYQKGKKDTGRQAYNPSDLLKLLIYGYMYRLSSSRRLEEECQKNLHLKWLVNGITPSFRTICYFREQNGKEIEAFFNSFVKKLFLNKLASNSLFATDGVKIKGYVSKVSKNKKQLEEYKEEITEGFNQFLKDFDDNNQDPKTKRKIYNFTTKLARIKKCEEKIESKEVSYVNPVDPDSLLLNNHGNRFRGFNVQATVESKGKYVVNVRIADKCYDSYEIIPTLCDINKKLGILPEKIVADKGYNTFSEILNAEDNHNVLVITELNQLDEDRRNGFTYDSEKDIYICPNNQIMTFDKKAKTRNGRRLRIYKCYHCFECTIKDKCTNSKSGRQISRPETIERETIFRENMRKDENQKIIKQRKGLIENVFGVVRSRMGYIPLLLRGVNKVSTEINLYFIGYNITRYINNLRKALNNGFFLSLYNFICNLSSLRSSKMIILTKLIVI
jgi:transposase